MGEALDEAAHPLGQHLVEKNGEPFGPTVSNRPADAGKQTSPIYTLM